MLSEELKEVVNQLNSQGEMSFLEAATVEQIVDFEKAKDIVLPKGYKEWLKFSDGGELFLPAGAQFYGVANKPLIDVDDEDKPDDTYLVIGALCTGDPILCQKDSERISIYNHEDGTIEDDETYENFLTFLADMPEILGIEE